MTPARFDLLYLLRRAHLGDPEHSTPLTASLRQCDLWRMLGLHRSTVAELVDRLLEMGWIWRQRWPFDRRTWQIFLTKLGLRRIFRAMKRVFQERVLLEDYENLYRGPEKDAPEPTNPVVRRINRAVVTARRIARWFGDRSCVWYDYGFPKENFRLGVSYRLP
jgi:DNA-binding MarR family transcriptional regulator